MSTLPTYFKEALHNIEPEADVKNAKTAHPIVSAVLTADDDLKALGINPVLIGSYAREVSIKRIKDVDVFGRLEDADETLSPGHALDLFEAALIKEFGEARIERQARSIKVDFPDYDLTVDTVPARPCGDHWELPNRAEDAGRAAWVETNPLLLNELTTKTNQRYTLNDEGIYVPVVKLIRQVRRTWIGDHPGGFFFEILTYWAFNNQTLEGDSIAEYVTLALESIAEMLPDVAQNGLPDATLEDKTISTKATSEDFNVAISGITEASKLARDAFEDDDDCSAAAKWQKLFGKTSDDEFVFPLPTYCNPDGSRKAVSSVTPGAVKVPAGNDRYA